MSDSHDDEATSQGQPHDGLSDDVQPHDDSPMDVEEAPAGPNQVADSPSVEVEDPVEEVEPVEEDGPVEEVGPVEVAGPDERAEQPKGRRDVMIVGAVLVLVLSALVGALLFTGSTDPVYTVYDQEVSRDELTDRLDGFLDPTTIEAVGNIEEASAEQRSQLAQAISTFITEDAMATAAQAEDIDVSDAAVDDQVEEIVQTGFEGDQSQFEAAIAQTGQTLELVRTQFRTALYAEALVGEVEPVTEADIQSFYDSNFTAPLVSHILVETEDEAQDAKDRIDGGEAFGAVAQDVSVDTSAAQGGRLGPLETGAYVAPFEEAAVALEPGEVSGPVETQFGWHIITVEPPPALEEVAEQVRSQIEENRLNEAFLALATRLDEDAEITVDSAFGTWEGLGGGGLVPAGLSVDEAPAQQLPDDLAPPVESEE